MTPDGWSFALKSSDSSSGTLSSLCPFGVGALGWLCDKLIWLWVTLYDFDGFVYLVFRFVHSLIPPLICIYLMWSSDQSSSCHCFFMLKHLSFRSFLRLVCMSSVWHWYGSIGHASRRSVLCWLVRSFVVVNHSTFFSHKWFFFSHSHPNVYPETQRSAVLLNLEEDPLRDRRMAPSVLTDVVYVRTACGLDLRSVWQHQNRTESTLCSPSAPLYMS